MFDTFNPALIRNYHFIKDSNNKTKIQFIAIGDKHRLMKQNDGELVIIKEKEKGKPYRYGKPCDINDAIDFLGLKSYSTHSEIAKHIQNNAPSA